LKKMTHYGYKVFTLSKYGCIVNEPIRGNLRHTRTASPEEYLGFDDWAPEDPICEILDDIIVKLDEDLFKI